MFVTVRGVARVHVCAHALTHLLHVGINEWPSTHNFMCVDETPDLIHDGHLLEKGERKCMRVCPPEQSAS